MNRLLTPTFMEQQVIPKITSLFRLKWLVWFVISVGIFLRVVQYLLDRSLWIDEAFVALNIINRSYAELLQPLDYNQGAPFGFLVIEKFIVQVFGDSEYSLRLLPFISGIAALFLFYWVARRLSNWSTTVIALALFALCDRAIYYSAEVKQYSSDVAIALILYLLITEIEAKK